MRRFATITRRCAQSAVRCCERVAGVPVGFALLCAQAVAQVDAPQGQDDAALRELTRPSSTVEIGVGAGAGGLLPGGGAPALLRDGMSPVGSFDLRGSAYSYRNPDDDMTRWRLIGHNLGLRAPSVSGEYGRQGRYRLTLGYTRLRSLASDSYQTPLRGAGTATLALPPGFVTGADTRAMPTLATDMRGFDVALVRERIGLDWTFWLAHGWQASVRLRNDAVNGSRIRGAEFGSNGGNARSMLLPEPVDSATQRVDASVAYAGDDMRWALAYHGSMYRNHVGALTWQNPYTNARWVGGATGLPTNFMLAQGRLGLAPDNDFHQLSLDASFDISRTTRLALRTSRGRMTQNQAFVPYTINPGLATAPLPRASLQGRVETRFVSARLSMRPVRKLLLTGSLRFEDRDNKTPQSEYRYVGGDVLLQPDAGADSDHIRTNLARSRSALRWTLKGEYRLPGAHRLQVGWGRETIRRTYAEVERTVEHSYRVAWRHTGAGPWTASAGLERLRRRGGTYLYNVSTLASYTSQAYVNGLLAANACLDALACIRTGPLPQKFYLADRNRDRLRLAVGYLPSAGFDLQARADLQQDRYPHARYGVQSAIGWTFGADASVAVGPDVRATLFYTLEQQRTREQGRQVVSGAGTLAGNSDSDWSNTVRDRTHSLGVGLHGLHWFGGRLTMDIDLVAVRGRTPIWTTVGPDVTAAQNPAGTFPDLRFQSDNLSLAVRYRINPNDSLRFRYLYGKLRQDDWAYAQVDATTLANVVGTTQAPWRRTVHGVGVTFVHRFR